MAFNPNLSVRKQPLSLQSHDVGSSTALAAKRNSSDSRYDELSSASVDSAEWILFSPSMNEKAAVATGSEVLSISVNDRDSQLGADHEEDDDFDDASLLDSLEAHSPMRLFLPKHDGSGQFSSMEDLSPDDGSYVASLTKEENNTNRIDSWKREQAGILFDELKRGSETGVSRSESNELLASWGVDDGKLSANGTQTQPPAASEIGSESEETYSFTKNKRFYGDELFRGLTEREVKKIKEIAKKMSSSLCRTSDLDYANQRSPYQAYLSKGRRLSMILSLSRATANRNIFDTMNQPFWKQDISSAHSSLSMDTSSIMFGNLHMGDAF